MATRKNRKTLVNNKTITSCYFRKLMLAVLLFCVCLVGAYAQRNEIVSDNIRTLQVVANDRWMRLPVINLNSDDYVCISFDDMTHDYHRYAYTIEHCEADWSVTDGLFESEYLDGRYDNLIIEDNEQSINMATLYTHYQLRLPNDECGIKMSGNYRVTIKDDNSGDVVAYAYFMVCEQRMGISAEVFTNTDIDFNHSHQQLGVKIAYNNVQVTDPDRQVKTYTLQNNRWTTVRELPHAQFISKDGLQWSHCRELIFPATNEYHKFEYLDLHRNSMGVDHTGFDGTDYHVWLNTDTPRPAYVYDEDANGAFLIRNTWDENNDTESEYFVAHFTYYISQPFDGEVFVNGQWTNDRLLDEYRMDYDSETKMYHCAIPLKMGYYSYQYLLRNRDGSVIYLPSEGNHYETENSYTVLTYYRPTGGRTDLLVGISQ